MTIKIITGMVLALFHFLIMPAQSLLKYEEPMALCIGDIIFHTQIDPDLCLYYKGDKLQLDINYDKKSKKIGKEEVIQQLVNIVPYSLTETKATQKFHILICCRPEFASDENTIDYLYIPHDTPYKFYTLSAARLSSKDNQLEDCLWTVSQESLGDKGIVPDNTIIFLFNADFIEGLQVKSWPSNSNIRILPSIVLKQSIDRQDVLRAIVQARLAAIDFDVVHRHRIQAQSKRDCKSIMVVQP